MLNWIELLIVLLGLGVTPILFYRFPRISEESITREKVHRPRLSVIIPARNEESTLPLLLQDLKNQRIEPEEIIVADDASTDATAEIAASFGVKVHSLTDKPEGWLGKTWACQNGADAAEGELLLFLDADVRLGEDGIGRLLKTYEEKEIPLSVQPYHITEKWHEQGSLLFNLIQIGANGTSLPEPLNIGLYGPLILMAKNDYERIGGHESVKSSIVEDMALGERLKEESIPYDLFVGDQDISFRMYAEGAQNLVHGWTKNMASGAMKVPLLLFLLVFLFISSMISVPLHVLSFAAAGKITWMFLYLGFYLVWTVVLHILSKKVGAFRFQAVVLFPILLLVMLYIFSVSIVKKVFGLKVTWKGRSI